MVETILKAANKLPMHIKVILAEKTEKVTFAKGYLEILVSKDDSIFENEIEPFYRLCKELSKESQLRVKKSSRCNNVLCNQSKPILLSSEPNF